MSTAGAVVAAVGSAAFFGVASAREHHVASAAETRRALDPGLLVSLARNSAWLLAFGFELVAVGLQLLALRWGAVALVQPLLVLGLPLAVLVAARLKHQQLAAAEWVGISLCGAGVTVLALLLPESTSQQAHSAAGTLPVLLFGLAVAGLAALPGRPAVTGAAAGIAAGVGTAALALCSERLTDIPALLTSWPPYVALVGGVLALQLGQAAFQGERLGAPLAAATLLEPVTAVMLSAAVLHQRLSTGALSLACSILATGAAAVGVVLLARHQPVAEPVP